MPWGSIICQIMPWGSIIYIKSCPGGQLYVKLCPGGREMSNHAAYAAERFESARWFFPSSRICPHISNHTSNFPWGSIEFQITPWGSILFQIMPWVDYMSNYALGSMSCQIMPWKSRYVKSCSIRGRAVGERQVVLPVQPDLGMCHTCQIMPWSRNVKDSYSRRIDFCITQL